MTASVAARVAVHVPALLVYLDHGLTVRFASRHCRELLGRLPGELVGRPLAELLDPGTLRYVLSHVMQLDRGDGAPREYVLRDVRGRQRIVTVHAAPDRDALGRSVGYFALTCDGGPLREMRHELRDTEARLARILETALALAGELDERRELDRTRTRLLVDLARELHATVRGGESAAPSPERGKSAP